MSGIGGLMLFYGEEIPGTWHGERFVATSYGWKKMTALIKGKDCGLSYKGCCHYATELHHPGGRGMNGSKRDDRKVIPVDRHCHDIEEEKRRAHKSQD